MHTLQSQHHIIQISKGEAPTYCKLSVCHIAYSVCVIAPRRLVLVDVMFKPLNSRTAYVTTHIQGDFSGTMLLLLLLLIPCVVAISSPQNTSVKMTMPRVGDGTKGACMCFCVRQRTLRGEKHLKG